MIFKKKIIFLLILFVVMFAIKFVFKHLLFELNYCFLYSFILSIFFILSKIISYNLSNKGKCLTKRDLILAVILGFLYFLAVNINIMYIKELICIMIKKNSFFQQINLYYIN